MIKPSRRSVERRKQKTRIHRGRFYLSRIISNDVTKAIFISEIRKRWMMGRDYKKLIAAIENNDPEEVGRYVNDLPFREAYMIATRYVGTP